MVLDMFGGNAMTELEQFKETIKLQAKVIEEQKEIIKLQEQRADLQKLLISILEDKLGIEGETLHE